MVVQMKKATTRQRTAGQAAAQFGAARHGKAWHGIGAPAIASLSGAPPSSGVPNIYKIILADLRDEWQEVEDAFCRAAQIAHEFFNSKPEEKKGLYKKTRAAFRDVDFHLMTIRSMTKTIKEARWQ